MTQPFLQVGDEGPSVSAAQLALAALGFDVGPVDGIFGDTTGAGVITFQESQGLATTGSLDEATWAALASQEFDQSEATQINATEFPSLARVIYFSEDFDAYLSDLGIDATTISDDEEPVG